MAKLGRPKLENSRRINLSWRVTESEYQKIKQYSAEHNMTISQIIQKGVELLYQKQS